MKRADASRTLAQVLLLECVPVDLAQAMTEALEIPVIGIGAGPHTDGQIMVMHDALGITPPEIKLPKFIKNFMPESLDGIRGAFVACSAAVKSGAFPAPEHCFTWSGPNSLERIEELCAPRTTRGAPRAMVSASRSCPPWGISTRGISRSLMQPASSPTASLRPSS